MANHKTQQQITKLNSKTENAVAIYKKQKQTAVNHKTQQYFFLPEKGRNRLSTRGYFVMFHHVIYLGIYSRVCHCVLFNQEH